MICICICRYTYKYVFAYVYMYIYVYAYVFWFMCTPFVFDLFFFLLINSSLHLVQKTLRSPLPRSTPYALRCAFFFILYHWHLSLRVPQSTMVRIYFCKHLFCEHVLGDVRLGPCVGWGVFVSGGFIESMHWALGSFAVHMQWCCHSFLSRSSNPFLISIPLLRALTLPSILCAPHFIFHTLHVLPPKHCPLCTTHSTVHTLPLPLHMLHCYTAHSAHPTSLSIAYTLHFTLRTLHSTL